MAGSISLSLSQQFDRNGSPLSGGLLYFIQASTVATPQNAYQDVGLTIPHPNPITLDAAGRIPPFYLADGSIKVRLTDANGVEQVVADNLLVVGPSSGGGGGGGGVDPTTVFQTGDVMWLDVQGTRSGWVRENGRTLGNATSGATERANSDVQALFVWLWGKYSDTLCPVSTGRGGDGLSDFNAGKTIQLLDKRGNSIGGLDDMGNSAAGLYASAPVVSGGVTTPGSVVGGNTSTLVTGNLPPYTPSGSITDGPIAFPAGTLAGTSSANFGGEGSGQAIRSSASMSATQSGTTFTGTPQGGTSTPVSVAQRTSLGTFYRKL
ncbi:MAG: hypothetical protein EKK40_07025 [Bradyrhizobiaceae bacterium]|nr:MAG: hypothetical protein EKK40_07025 [Bradyrhizobiaceae bacterium]